MANTGGGGQQNQATGHSRGGGGGNTGTPQGTLWRPKCKKKNVARERGKKLHRGGGKQGPNKTVTAMKIKGGAQPPTQKMTRVGRDPRTPTNLVGGGKNSERVTTTHTKPVGDS